MEELDPAARPTLGRGFCGDAKTFDLGGGHAPSGNSGWFNQQDVLGKVARQCPEQSEAGGTLLSLGQPVVCAGRQAKANALLGERRNDSVSQEFLVTFLNGSR